MRARTVIGAAKAVAYTAALGLVIGGTYCADKSQNKKRDSLNKEIQMKDSARYNNIVKAHKEKDFYFVQEQAKKMNDSLKIDSASKKAYFEGAQMVRDSLKKAQKVVK